VIHEGRTNFSEPQAEARCIHFATVTQNMDAREGWDLPSRVNSAY
jgi:hypothetical protein